MWKNCYVIVDVIGDWCGSERQLPSGRSAVQPVTAECSQELVTCQVDIRGKIKTSEYWWGGARHLTSQSRWNTSIRERHSTSQPRHWFVPAIHASVLSSDMMFIRWCTSVFVYNTELWFIYHAGLSRRRVTHQGAARDAASVHFRPSITRTDILLSYTLMITSNASGCWNKKLIYRRGPAGDRATRCIRLQHKWPFYRPHTIS